VKRKPKLVCLTVLWKFCSVYFQYDEYAVYNTNQQRIRYLVEFTASGDPLPIERVISDPETVEVEHISTESQQKGFL